MLMILLLVEKWVLGEYSDCKKANLFLFGRIIDYRLFIGSGNNKISLDNFLSLLYLFFSRLHWILSLNSNTFLNKVGTKKRLK
jgi:hypothetical protein